MPLDTKKWPWPFTPGSDCWLWHTALQCSTVIILGSMNGCKFMSKTIWMDGETNTWVFYSYENFDWIPIHSTKVQIQDTNWIENLRDMASLSIWKVCKINVYLLIINILRKDIVVKLANENLAQTYSQGQGHICIKFILSHHRLHQSVHNLTLYLLITENTEH